MDVYRSPFETRYSSGQMLALFSPLNYIKTWRKLWIALAKGEKELGLNISDKQIRQLEQNVENIDLNKIKAYEKEFKHDVMANIHAYGDVAPDAKGIIHLGATSCFVTDNADLILIREALNIIKGYLVYLLKILANRVIENKDIICLGYTHFQPAQFTTIGKRLSLYLYDFYLDYKEITRLIKNLPFRSIKGATGTQASFLKLLGSNKKVKRLESYIADYFGFSNIVEVSGQTYSRKIDSMILKALAGIGESAHKLGTDIRLMQHTGEISESFGKKQVGSSAMPYKRNPIKSERLCAISRYLISLQNNLSNTHATQWLERSLDDSANRRIVIPQAFFSADAVLSLASWIVGNININIDNIKDIVDRYIPYTIMENILMEATKRGEDRQEIHRILNDITSSLKHGDNLEDFIKKIDNDDRLPITSTEIYDMIKSEYLYGLAPEQAQSFANMVINNIKNEKEIIPPTISI